MIDKIKATPLCGVSLLLRADRLAASHLQRGRLVIADRIIAEIGVALGEDGGDTRAVQVAEERRGPVTDDMQRRSLIVETVDAQVGRIGDEADTAASELRMLVEVDALAAIAGQARITRASALIVDQDRGRLVIADAVVAQVGVVGAVGRRDAGVAQVTVERNRPVADHAQGRGLIVEAHDPQIFHAVGEAHAASGVVGVLIQVDTVLAVAGVLRGQASARASDPNRGGASVADAVVAQIRIIACKGRRSAIKAQISVERRAPVADNAYRSGRIVEADRAQVDIIAGHAHTASGVVAFAVEIGAFIAVAAIVARHRAAYASRRRSIDVDSIIAQVGIVAGEGRRSAAEEGILVEGYAPSTDDSQRRNGVVEAEGVEVALISGQLDAVAAIVDIFEQINALAAVTAVLVRQAPAIDAHRRGPINADLIVAQVGIVAGKDRHRALVVWISVERRDPVAVQLDRRDDIIEAFFG